MSDADRKDGFDMIKRCADRGVPACIANLGWFYASSRNPNSPSPVPPDDQQALRLWDAAAAKGNTAAARDAAKLRAKLNPPR